MTVDVKGVSNQGYAVQGSSATAPVSAPVAPVEAPEKERPDKTVTESGAATVAQDGQDQQKKPGGAASNEALKEAVDKINKNANTEAVFGIHEKTNRVTIKIVDKETKKTIKEIPAEETLDLIAKAWEMAGILVDEKR